MKANMKSCVSGFVPALFRGLTFFNPSRDIPVPPTMADDRSRSRSRSRSPDNRNGDSGGDGGNDNMMPPQSSGHDDHNNGDDNGHHNGGGGEDRGNSNEVKLYIGNLDYGAFNY